MKRTKSLKCSSKYTDYNTKPCVQKKYTRFFYYLIWKRRFFEGDQGDNSAIDFRLWIIIFKNIFENCIKVCNFLNFAGISEGR